MKQIIPFIKRKPYYLLYAISFIGLFTVWLVPFFKDTFLYTFPAMLILFLPIFIGNWLQYSQKKKDDASNIRKKPLWKLIVQGILLIVTVLLLICVIRTFTMTQL